MCSLVPIAEKYIVLNTDKNNIEKKRESVPSFTSLIHLLTGTDPGTVLFSLRFDFVITVFVEGGD